MYSMNSIEEIRGQFPALQQLVYGKPLVYLDNGATSQKPLCVIDLVDRMHKGANANVHRAMHKRETAPLSPLLNSYYTY